MPHDLKVLQEIHEDFLAFGTSSVDTATEIHIGRPHGGLALLWRQDLGGAVKVNDFGDPRILGVTVTATDQTLAI